jgi:tetratricopeptide (TPR) repeat protein
MNILSSTKSFLLTALLLVGSLSVHAETIDELISKGDVCDKRLQAGEALKYYLPAEKIEPKNEPLLLRIARQYRHLMADASAREEKLRLGNTALEYAQRAVALAPNDSESHLSVAITYGKMLPIFGTRQQVETSPKIKSEVDQAIRLNPRNDLAWHILGRWNRVLADVSTLKRTLAPLLYGKLPKGTNEEAAKCLEKAIELNPSRLMHYIELGRVYAQQGRNAEARRMLEKGLSMPSTEKDDPEAKARGREVLEKLRS